MRLRCPDDVEPGGTASACWAWGSEANFNRWLTRPEALAQLGGSAGLNLELLDRETSSDAGRCDLLCYETHSEAVVVIESQFGASDLDHALRLLGYALEHDAAHAILVAEHHTAQVVEFCNLISRVCLQACCLKLQQVQVVAAADITPVAWFTEPTMCASDDNFGVGALPVLKLARADRNKITAFVDWAADLCVQEQTRPVPMPDAKLEQVLLAKERMLVAWLPVRPETVHLAQILQEAARHRAQRICVVVTGWPVAVQRWLAILHGCATAQITVIRARNYATQNQPTNRLSLRRIPEGQLAAHSATWQRQVIRRKFWMRAASVVSTGTGQLVRRKRALGQSSRGLVFGLGCNGIRMATLYRVGQRCFCVEVRIQHANSAQAANQFAQLRDCRDHLSSKLAGQFEFEWAGGRLRANEQTLRLYWRYVTAQQPFADLQLADKLGAAVVLAREALVPVVRQMESYRW